MSNPMSASNLWWVDDSPKVSIAQPIFDKEFLKLKPTFQSPVDGFYIANMDMTYPYDRATNYAVQLGRTVAGMI